jgi:hypothetical protein
MVENRIFTAKTFHKRFFPKVNKFTYGIYYLTLPLSQIDNLRLLSPLISFRAKDHAGRDGASLRVWIDEILQVQKIVADGEIVLVAIPRIFGYVFNPVSFWFCFDKAQKLRAVLAEVNNTFGETHSYLCYNKDGSEIMPSDVFEGEKLFHVSPFLSREGEYQFRFDFRDDKLGVWIDLFQNGEKILATNLLGNLVPLTRKNLLKCFFKYPLVTIKVIGLIHYQALKLLAKGIKYISKPLQKAERLSQTYKNVMKNT